MKTGKWIKRIILGLMCLCCAVGLGCFGRALWLSRGLVSQQQALRWQGESELSFAQISCFLPKGSEATVQQIHSFRQTAAQSLQEAVPEKEVKALYRDCWSCRGEAEVSTALGRGTAQVTAVGGAFFEFHPIPLLSGGYLGEQDLMQDRVVLDEELAWLLFGGTELQGLPLRINGQNFVVAGVVDRAHDRENALAWPEDSMGLYMSYSTWEALNENAGAACYEFVMAQPVKGLAMGLAGEKFPVKEAQLLENTGRFRPARLFELLGDYGKRSAQTEPLAYPYWENAARYTEDVCALLLLVGCALVLPLLLGGLVRGVLLLCRGKRKLSEELLPRAVESTQEAIRVRQRRRWERKHGLHEKK